MADDQGKSPPDEHLAGVTGGRWDDGDTAWSVVGVGAFATAAKFGRSRRLSLGERLARIDNGEIATVSTQVDSGASTTHYKDGSVAYEFHAGGRSVRFPDGMRYEEIPTQDGIVKRILEPSGLQRTIYPDGREEILEPGKGTRVVGPGNVSNGGRVPAKPDLEVSQEDDNETDVGDDESSADVDDVAHGD